MKSVFRENIGEAVVGLLVVVLAAKGRLAKHDPAPTASLEEIRKDKQWLKNEL